MIKKGGTKIWPATRKSIIGHLVKSFSCAIHTQNKLRPFCIDFYVRQRLSFRIDSYVRQRGEKGREALHADWRSAQFR